MQGQLYTAGANRSSNRIDGYTVANARLTWRNARNDVEAALEVINVTGKYYYLTVSDGLISGAGTVVAQPGRPREWAVSVKKKF